MTLENLFSPKETPMRLAIFMSGSGSNAKKIIEQHIAQKVLGDVSYEPVVIITDNFNSNAVNIAGKDFEDVGFQIPVVVNSIRGFYQKAGFNSLRDMNVREQYDLVNAQVFESFGVDTIALAGYDWVISPFMCDSFLMMNVHPGDLRERFPEGHKNQGSRRYVGLGWVPSAKAILNGEKQVYTSVHQVTSELDDGPLLAISNPQQVPVEAQSLDRSALLGEAKNIGGILKFIRENPEISDEELTRRFPIYGFASDCQERLKVNGDWIIFPRVIDDLARGFYKQDKNGLLYLRDKPLTELV